MSSIFTRRSIRRYTDEKVTEAQLKEIVKAGMAAPSATNEQPWHFVVITDKDTLLEITGVHPHSAMLKEAAAAVVVCFDPELENVKGFLPQDCAAATQNILLRIDELGLGGVWLGVYPNKEREDGVRKVIGAPERIVPFSIVSIGYPAEKKPPHDRYLEDRVHWGKW
ncbi:MAG: hypothetical protein PWQ88_953 [Candidatus Methanomethylophilaceae archaeon]|nr:hypothetical protein [Candidatus Methanomethylophilaceae archaeon]MDI3542131.1 hypothetical protein [Candidatus Methanomethylophilaceae archaeon]